MTTFFKVGAATAAGLHRGMATRDAATSREMSETSDRMQSAIRQALESTDTDIEVICDLCLRSFADGIDLQRHLIRAHGVES